MPKATGRGRRVFPDAAPLLPGVTRSLEEAQSRADKVDEGAGRMDVLRASTSPELTVIHGEGLPLRERGSPFPGILQVRTLEWVATPMQESQK